MPTLRAPFGHGAVGVRLGVSGGEYAWQEGLSGYLVHVWPNAVWFNLELIADLRWDHGFQAGVSAGFGSLLNSTDYNCGGTGPDCAGDGGTTIPYIAVRLGYSFGL
jgi:hypothetical protein